MKRSKLWISLTIIFFILLILPGTTAADDESESLQLAQGQANQNGIKFGFRITGGASLLMRNDINDHLQSYNDLFEDDPYFTVDSEFELIKMGTDFSGEILVSFMPNLSVGIGAGYISAGKETTMELSYTSYSEDSTYNIKFSAIPITLSFYYGVPVGSSMQVMLNAGLGYYLGTVDFNLFFEGDTGFYTDEGTDNWSAKSNALGFHGGIDLEFGIAHNLALVVGAKGRYAKLTDLTGTKDYDYSRSTGYSYSYYNENATLWFGDYKEGSKKYSLVQLSEDKPSGSSWSNVRKAEVNLSGIVFQAGIKVFF